ncbi:hypothetical protein REPUB_Repub17cG0191600 [Reevesia pubescens]
MGCHFIELEGDALRVIQLLKHNDDDLSPAGNIVMEGRIRLGVEIIHAPRVGLPSDQKGAEAKNLAADIDGITIKDEFSNNSYSSKNGGFPWKDKQPNNATLGNQATVGSLTFNVIDASSVKPSGESSRQAASGDVGASGKSAEKPKSYTREPAPQTKVPFEKGYSQMDWLKLTQTHPDLAGLKGQSNRRLISMSEVKQNQTEGSMWTVLKGRVYNISPYMKFHPGGVDMIFHCGSF